MNRFLGILPLLLVLTIFAPAQTTDHLGHGDQVLGSGQPSDADTILLVLGHI